MSLLAKGVFTSLIIFGVGSYASYRYNEFSRYEDELSKVRSEGRLRSFLYDIHQGSQEIKEVLPNTSLPKEGHYREVLLSYSEGVVLETGVGFTDNIRFYPKRKVARIFAVDWVGRCIEYGLINNKDSRREYKLEDCENLSFEESSFDTVVDIFGLQYYANPEKVLSEMRRVCKNEGKILILAKGKSHYQWFNRYLDLNNAKCVCLYGMNINQDWGEVIEKQGIEVVKAERKINGTLYFYILRNKKPEEPPKSEIPEGRNIEQIPRSENPGQITNSELSSQTPRSENQRQITNGEVSSSQILARSQNQGQITNSELPNSDNQGQSIKNDPSDPIPQREISGQISDSSG